MRVNSVAFLTDGDRLATASGDGLVRVWNITAGTVEASRRGHAAGIWSLAIDPVTQLTATGSADGSGRLWSLAATGGPVVSLGGRGLALCNSSTGNGLAAGLADERASQLAGLETSPFLRACARNFFFKVFPAPARPKVKDC